VRLLGVLGVAVLGGVVTALVLAVLGAFDGEGAPGRQDAAATATAATLQVGALYDRLSPGVVFIQAEVVSPGTSPFGPEQPRRGVSTGTGFLIDRRGSIVTNAHVVENAERVALQLDGNRFVQAKLVGSDLSSDLALLRVEPDALDADPLPLGDSGEVRVGEPVVAIGNPFGLEDTITSGIVSALQRRITAPNGFAIEGAVQTDAAINPGNSGGPLLDADGRVIGVNSQIATGGEDRSSAGIGFAVPVQTVKEIIPDLADDGRVARPYVGLSVVPVTPSLARQLRLESEQGALVVSVVEGSPADRAGLRGAAGAAAGSIVGGGDVILRVGGQEVRTGQAITSALGDRKPGDRVELTVSRAGQRRSVTFPLAQRPTG